MNETVLVALVFAVLLGIEWRYRLRSVRLGTAGLALVVWLFAQPNYIGAARRVSVAPPEERITTLRGDTISEYLSGVTTMLEAIDDVNGAYATIRLLALGVLVWLACTPAFRRAPGSSPEGSLGRRFAEGTE